MINSLSPYVRLAMRSQITPPWNIRKRVIFDYELIYLESGNILLTVGDKEYVCSEGDIILLHPFIPHSIRSIGSERISQPHVHFDMIYDEYSRRVYISFKDIKEFSEEEKKMIRPDILKGIIDNPIINADKALVKKQLFKIIDTFKQENSMSALHLKIQMLELLNTVFTGNTTSLRAERYDISSMLRDYIDNNYTNAITLEGLSKQFNYNKYYLEKAFTSKYGISVKKYYTSLRIKAIKRDISRGKSIANIVEKYNFTSIYSFSRFFKNEVGISPSIYAKENNTDKKE